MAEQSRTTLKGYFNTGDFPTEAQFADLIDSAATPTELAAGLTGVLTETNTATVTGKSIDAAQLTGLIALARLANMLSADTGNTLTAAPKFWVGASVDYEAIAVKDPNTLYFTS